MTMSERADHPPVDHPGEPSLMSQVCDIVRYAPIAILLDGPGMLPKLAQQGKVHVGNARYLGRRAIREAEPALRRLAQGLGEQAGGLLQVVGVVPPASPPGGAAPAPSSPAPSGAAPAPEPVSGNGSSPPAPTGPAADDLAIPDYESLSASHVVNRLPGLTPDELEAVRLYETAHRGRKTILNKVAQLQAAG
jgi:hypothetical protein